MSGGVQRDGDIAGPKGLSKAQGLFGLTHFGTVARGHDRERFRCCGHRSVPRLRVIRMSVGDDSAVDGPNRVDVKLAGHDIEPGLANLDPAFGFGGDMVRMIWGLPAEVNSLATGRMTARWASFDTWPEWLTKPFDASVGSTRDGSG